MCALPLLAVGIGDGFVSCMNVSRLYLFRSSSDSLASDSSDSVLSPESESLPELEESLSEIAGGGTLEVAEGVVATGFCAVPSGAAAAGFGEGRSKEEARPVGVGGERRGPRRGGIIFSDDPPGGAS